MAKAVRRSMDAAKRSTSRKTYKAPAVRRKPKTRKKRKSIPKNYKTLRKPKKQSSGFIWFLLILFLATLSGFINYNKQDNSEIKESLEMNIEYSNKITSGDQVEYVISYKNLDDITLTKLELSVQWSSGFYFDESDVIPHDLAATTWLLPDLEANQKKEIVIKGQLVGQKEEILQAIFNLTYQPENFHSDFNSKQIIETEIIDSSIELNIESIDKTLIGVEQDFIIKVKNPTDKAINELYLDILYPDDLEILSTDMEKVEDYWILNLEPEAEFVMTTKGIFNTDSKSKQMIVSELGTMVEEKFRPLSRVEKDIYVINPKFEINLTINGKDDDQNIDWGDILHYQLEITNNSDSDITDIQVNSLLDGDAIDSNSIDSIGIYNNSIISWTKEELEELENWEDGDTKIFTWEAKVTDLPISERLIENIVKINIQGLENWEQVSSSVLLNVGESLSFNNGIYWDLGGIRVGSGSLPPQVGSETNYLVVWSIPEATGDFDTVSIDSILPPSVSFLEEADIQDGNLSFDEETRELNWNIETFDDLILPTTASFMIKLEPTSDYIGQAMSLLNTTSITAQGLEEVLLSSGMLKTSDVISESNEPIGIIE